MHYLLRANEKANKEVNGDATLMSIIKEARKQSSKRYNKYFLYRMNYANYRRGDILSEKKIYQR